MTKRSRTGQTVANYGITGNVTARAVAVGKGARAVSNQTIAVGDRDKLAAAVKDLQKQISRLSIPAESAEGLKSDVEGLKGLGSKGEPVQDRASDVLGGLVGRLKALGVLVETIKPLSGAVKAVAAICGVPLPF